MIKKNELVQSAVDNLYKNLKDEDYDTKFKWAEIEKLCGVRNLSQQNLYYVANRVCLMLMQYDRKYLATLPGFGKRIIKPDEHGIVAKKKVKQSVRLYKRAGEVLQSTNMDELSKDQQVQVIQDANKYATLEMFAKEVLRKKKIGVRSKEDIANAGLFLDAIKLFTK